MTTPPEAGPGIARVSHLLLEVDDLARSVAFYVDLLGFEVRQRDTLADGRPFVATVQGLGITTRAAGGGSPSFDHLAFRVPQGIAPLQRLLEARGIAYESPRRTPYGLSIYFRDPDGYRLEAHDSTGVGGEA